MVLVCFQDQVRYAMKLLYSIKNQRDGFTLIELMTVVGIIAVLVGIGVPMVASYLPNYYLNQASRDVMSNLQLAKLTAVRTNTRCVAEFTPGVFKTEGAIGQYRIYLDSNNDWTDKDAAGVDETIVLNATQMPNKVTMYDAVFTDNGAGGAAATRKIGFDAKGVSARAMSGMLIFGDVKMRNSNNDYARVVVSPTGHIRISKSADGQNWD